jgi:hypothetical protein
MSIRNAALLATIGTAVLAILLLLRFVNDLLALMRGLIPGMDVLASLVYVFAAVTVVVFFFVFHRGQSS